MLLLKKPKKIISNVNQVYITDEDCIFDACKQIIDELILNPNPSLALVYAYSNRFPLHSFEQGVDFLEKRFSKKLLIYKVSLCLGSDRISYEFMKALLKTKTSRETKFFLFGNSKFINHLSITLGFMGVQSGAITKSIFDNNEN